MATKTQKIKLGVFLSASFALLLITVAVLASQKLWDEKVRYYVRFSESVSGLEAGAPVKLRGVRVGAVLRVQLDPDNVEQVRVTLSLEPNTPIMRDSRASLMIQGITGLKFIEIHSGTEESELLPPGSYIKEGASIMAKITGSAEDVSIKAEKVLNNLLAMTGRDNQERLEQILEHSSELTRHLDELTVEIRDVLRENRGYLRGTMGNVDRTVAEVAELVVRSNAVVEGIDTATLKRSVESLTVTLDRFRGLLDRATRMMAQNEDQVRATMYNIRLATQSLREFGRTLQRQPSLLLFDDAPEERKLP